ncbi:MAG: hypothetical protein WBA59_09660 [Moheibacter sp.]
MRKNVLSILAVIAMGFIALSSSDDSSSSTSTNESSKESASWQYSQDTDEMDNSTRKIASLNSDNTIKFDFPYGNSSFSINVREWKGKTDVFLTCTKCQFIAGVMGEEKYRIKFDEEAPFEVPASFSSSAASDVVFLGNEKKIISKLKSAKTMMIEPQFYEVGYKPVKFKVEGFDLK